MTNRIHDLQLVRAKGFWEATDTEIIAHSVPMACYGLAPERREALIEVRRQLVQKIGTADDVAAYQQQVRSEVEKDAERVASQSSQADVG